MLHRHRLAAWGRFRRSEEQTRGSALIAGKKQDVTFRYIFTF